MRLRRSVCTWRSGERAFHIAGKALATESAEKAVEMLQPLAEAKEAAEWMAIWMTDEVRLAGG